ncbi:hypothetical protein [Nocardia sp. NPDC057455]|uniref:hypothetical protein n=1 Tax=Nocardia sp. NPDC057455 TaxID=3346138 RepID=UPI00366C4291
MVASVIIAGAVLWFMANFLVAMAVLEGRIGREVPCCEPRPATVTGTVAWMQAQTLPTTCPLVSAHRASA